MKKPSTATTALIRRIRAFEHGNLLDAAEVLEALEALIVADETSFDDSALLSKAVEDFARLSPKDAETEPREQWRAFLDGLSGKKAATKGSKPPPIETERTVSGLKVDVELLQSFLTEAREHLENIEPRVLSLEAQFDLQTVNEIFRAVHTIKGLAGFLDLEQIKSLSHELEHLLDGLRGGRLQTSSAMVGLLLQGCDLLQKMVHDLTGRAANMPVDKGVGTLELATFDLQALTEQFQTMQSSVPEVTSANAEIAELLQNPELIAKFAQEAVDTLETVEQCILTMEKTRKTGDYLNEAFRSIHTLKGNAGFFGFANLEKLCMEMEGHLDSLRKGQTQIGEESIQSLLRYLDRLKGLVQLSAAPKATPTTVIQAPAAAMGTAVREVEPARTDAEAGKYSVKRKDIRVDTEKLDSLFDLIGELITAEAMVIDNPELRGLELEGFQKAAAYLSKITRELQNITMSIRMIPLEGLFSKMNRLVRDLGRKFGKEIELDISGAETEMDRNIIEEISDPLVHIIRNAVDHGIEDTATRTAKGKAVNGKISLNARYEGNEIWITVSDDGAGLNRNRIVEVAIARGLIASGDNLSDADAFKLVFEPGFSTAKEVSEISGRGVGMDVVKKNLEKLRGQIDIQTVTDKGTDFVLKIPLTLAIIDGVTLRCGTMLYSLPIGDVVEFQNFDAAKLTSTDPHHNVMRLRGEILPVMALSDFFHSSDRGLEKATEKQVSIILKSQNRKMAVIVDEIVGYKQIVLKALPEFMAHLKGVSGCTIMGNGEVSLIIDVNALFQRYLD